MPEGFRELYDARIATLSTQKLNETFYKPLARWYVDGGIKTGLTLMAA